MTKTIICGLDSSETSAPVARVARDLANALKARLVAVHFDEEPLSHSWRGTTDLPAAMEVRRDSGPPAEGLLAMAETEDAELLIVGSRGRSLFGRSVIGSTSRRLISEAACPVVLVPPETLEGWAGSPLGDGSIVCGVDGSSQSLSAAQFAGGLAADLGCRVIGVHALQTIGAFVSYPSARFSTPPVTGQPDAVRRQAQQIVANAIGQLPVDATAVIEPGAPADVLQAVAERENACLFVIAARGAGAVRAVLLGSTAMSLAVSATRPVVVLSELAVLALARRAQTENRHNASLL